MEPPAGPVSLLVHDGELADVCALMGQLGIDFSERRGAPSPADEARSWDLVISTPKRLLEFDGGAVGSARVRIAIIDKDSKTLRSMLQRAGIDLIVRRPVHPAALRLLILHSLYRGPEKRRTRRVSIGASVRFRSGLRRRSAILADLSESGCRLLTAHPVNEGQQLNLSIPAGLARGKAFMLTGTVVRSTRCELPGMTAVALTFRNRSAKDNERLRIALAAHASGPAVLPEGGISLAAPAAAEAAPDASPREAKPADATARSSDPAPEPAAATRERRASPRHEYEQHVIALGAEAARVLIGRDISAGGMRVEPHPDVALGDELRIALHLRARREPLVIQARVARDEGARGLVLHFHDISESTGRYLRRMVNFLPILAVRQERGEGAEIVVSEILQHRMAEASRAQG